MSDQDDWVRRQLADLPPVPMPPEVRARMDAAIASEAANSRSAAGAAAQQPGEPPAAGEAPGAPRRRWLGLVGAAAALALFAMVVPLDLGGDPNGGDAVAEKAADPEAAAAPSSGAAADSDDAAGADRPSRLQIQQASLASPASYSADTIGERVRSFFSGTGGATSSAVPTVSPDEAPELPPSWQPVHQMAAATPEGLVECVWALPWDGELLVVVERAAYDADPAVIVVRHAGAQWEVLVQDAACSANDPSVVHRATVEQ